MDFGATICKPVPECAVCFFNKGMPGLFRKPAGRPAGKRKSGFAERALVSLHYFAMRQRNRHPAAHR
jgi:adenine-specific DNA glycosylase